MGNVIADAQLAATAGADVGNAVMAFMNPGGVRAPLTYAGSPVGEGDGVVTYGEAFTVQPFGNSLVTMTLTGAQIEATLEQQFCGLNDGTALKVLLPSAGIHYTWNTVLAGQARSNLRPRRGERAHAERQPDPRRYLLPGDRQQLPRRWWRRFQRTPGRHQPSRWRR